MAHPAQSRNDRFEDYIPVAERIEKFYERFPEGRIITSIIQHDIESGFILMRAEVFRQPDDAGPASTGHAFEVRGDSYVNRTSYIENCESSAVGRALALLGFEVKRSIASREEMEKASRMQEAKTARPAAERTPTPERAATTERAEESAPADDASKQLDAAIVQSANELGYDAAKVRKWVNQKYGVTGGLESLTEQDKREVLKIFREKAQTPPARAARK